MGRAKLAMKLITKEKARNITFQKRKNGLKKKAFELSTLCNIPVCLIIYGYKKDEQLEELDTWPSNPTEVRKIIDKYNAIPREDRNKRSVNLLDMLEGRKRKAEQDLFKLRHKILKAKYPTWHDCIDRFSKEQLKNLLANLDRKIEDSKRRIVLMKGKQVIDDPLRIMGSGNVMEASPSSIFISALPLSLLPLIPVLNQQQWQEQGSNQFLSNFDHIMNHKSPLMSIDPNPSALMTKMDYAGLIEMGNDPISNMGLPGMMDPTMGYNDGGLSAVANHMVVNGSGPSMWCCDPTNLPVNSIQLEMQPDFMMMKNENEFEMNGSSYCDYNELIKVFCK